MLRRKISLLTVSLLFSLSSYAAGNGQITFKGKIVDDTCLQVTVDELVANSIKRNACFSDVQKVSLPTSMTEKSSVQEASQKQVLVLTYH